MAVQEFLNIPLIARISNSDLIKEEIVNALEPVASVVYGAHEVGKLTGCSGLPENPRELVGFTAGAVLGLVCHYGFRRTLSFIDEELDKAI